MAERGPLSLALNNWGGASPFSGSQALNQLTTQSATAAHGFLRETEDPQAERL